MIFYNIYIHYKNTKLLPILYKFLHEFFSY